MAMPRHGNPQEQWARPDTQGGNRGGPVAGGGPAIERAELLEERPLFSKDGHPIICRTNDERALHPDRLNLDRRGFTLCPILEGEEQLKLINFQHNSITRIENMSPLRSLIFLDLYVKSHTGPACKCHECIHAGSTTSPNRVCVCVCVCVRVCESVR